MLRSIGEMLHNNWNMLTNSFLKTEEVNSVSKSSSDIDDYFEETLEALKTEFNAAKENQVRDLAYYLWEDAGRPDGRSDEFWRQAEESLNV